MGNRSMNLTSQTLSNQVSNNMNNPPKILAIMEDYMGHRTYSNLLRSGFRQIHSCEVDFNWYNEGRGLDTKIIRRLLSFSLPNRWIRQQNLDFRYSRIKIANANIARQLTRKKLELANYSGLYFHTYNLAFLSLDLLKKFPSVVSLDMTSYQAAKESTNPNYLWTHQPNFFLGKKVFSAATGIVTRSEWARQSVIQDYQINPDKVKVIYPGVDLEKLSSFQESNSTLKKPEKHQRFNILFVGNDFERKGGNDVLDVFLNRFSDVAELNIVSNAPLDFDYPYVHIHRNVQAYTPQWLNLYHQADVFVMPTHFEGFGWVFIEAMAAGLPVIATKINAIPEMVSSGETGFLIQPGNRSALADYIQQLIDNPTLRKNMGIAGRKVIEKKFNVQLHCQALEKLFLEVTAHS
jgi:glycosyltransferase involved in cell wall biosynthesis